LWSCRSRKSYYNITSNHFYLNFLLLLCGDIESCPGPPNARSYPELEKLTKLKGLKLFHHNKRGLWTNFHYITELLSSFQNIDILTLSETHTTSDDPGVLFHVEGYTFIKRDRLKGKRGGVALYLSNKYVEGEHWKRREDLENEIESICIEFSPPKSKSFIICTLYRPPDGLKYLLSNFSDLFRQLLQKASSICNELIVLGDINVDYLKKNNHAEIKSTFTTYEFKQLVKNPTRIDKQTETLIDIIASNNPSIINDTSVIPTSYSDHDMIGCVRKINYVKFKHKTIKTRNMKNYVPVRDILKHTMSHNEPQ